MEKLSKDLIILLSLDINIDDLTKFCQTSKKINKLVCNSDVFWFNRLRKDYPKIDISNVEIRNLKKLYEYLHSRTKVYETNIDLFTDFENDDEIQDDINFINEIQEEVRDYFSLKAGDIVIFREYPYRKYLWDGEKFLIDYADDYFTLNPPLNFPTFPPFYWGNNFTFQDTYVEKSLIDKSVIINGKAYLVGNFGERYNILFVKNYNNDEEIKKYLGSLPEWSFGSFNKDYEIELT